MKTIVSVTPLPVMADSRTYKIAASFSRFGYRSIVIEGQSSGVNAGDLPFELRTVRRRNSKSRRGGDTNARTPALFDHLPETLKLPFRMARALVRFFHDFGTRVAFVLPPASIYYLHAPYQFPGVALGSLRHPAPIIYDAHDVYPLVDQTPFLGSIESWCIRNADTVVTTSPGFAELLSNRYHCRPHVLRNVHDRRLDKAPGRGLRDFLGLGPDQFLLVCVGQVKTGQHVAGAFAALAELPSSIHIAFVGKNTDQFNNLALQHGVERRVHSVPPVNPCELVPFIRSADAAISLYFPLSLNYEYTLPNGLFQALAASLPQLYPPLAGIKTVIERYGLGIPIDPFSPDSIKTAVLELLTNPSRLKVYRNAALAASAELSWEKEESILRELVSRYLI